MIASLAAVAPAQAACLSDAQARQIVDSGRAVPLGSLRSQVKGDILKAQLCEQGGGYVYVLSVKNGSKVTTVTVRASR
ncbi:MAG: hypothetical protein Tsb0019_16030 [Roseibium sp.]